MIWFTGGHHFGHKNIALYEHRPDNWQQLAVERWNEVVKDDDTVIHVGDFVFGSVDYGEEILSWLNGRKIIILGNHDRSVANMQAMGFDEVYGHRKRAGYENPAIARFGRFAVSHAPLAELPQGCAFNVHGHIHSNGYSHGRKPWHVNVEVDVTSFYPISEKQILGGFR